MIIGPKQASYQNPCKRIRKTLKYSILNPSKIGSMTNQLTPLSKPIKEHPICFYLGGKEYRAMHNLITERIIDTASKRSFDTLAEWLNFCGRAPILVYRGYKIRRVPVGGTYTITPNIPSFDELKQGLRITDVQKVIDSYAKTEEQKSCSSKRRRRSQSFCGETDLEFHS